MNAREIMEYYSQEKVQEALIELSKNREVVGVFRNGSYDTRPNILVYPQDISAMVKTGVIEFHSSIERWSNPMNLKQDNYENLRIGWDLVLDLDLDYKVLDHGKIIAKSFIWGLKKHGIKNFSLKFTGSTGFHIVVPWEAMPKEINYEKTVKKFPGLPRKIANYLISYIDEKVQKEFFKKYSAEELAAQTSKPLGKILTTEGLNIKEVVPDFVKTDSVLLSPRHLFRMLYSLHRTTFLASVPLQPEELDDFQKKDAEPRKFKIKTHFLKEAKPNEAELLVAEAIDWKKKVEKVPSKERRVFRKRIPENLFPPCIKNILAGLEDGRKRSLFILINTLKTFKWSWNEIENFVTAWNQKNRSPLGDNYVRSQLRWHKGKAVLPPPNCLAQGYYMDIGICAPDHYCGGQKKTVKNPINYPWRRMGKKS